MPYCVNCGVKLANSLVRCPLCNTDVVNPVKSAKGNQCSEKPELYQKPAETFDKDLYLKLFSIIMSVLMLIVLALEFFFSTKFSWSLYVAGSLALVWFFCVSPFFFKRNIAPVWIACDTVALLVYLFLIEFFSPLSGWFFSLAVPIVISFAFFIEVIGILMKLKILRELHVPAAITLAVGLFCMILEATIDLYRIHIYSPGWSMLVFIPCTAFALILFVLQKRRWIVEEMKHWFRM